MERADSLLGNKRRRASLAFNPKALLGMPETAEFDSWKKIKTHIKEKFVLEDKTRKYAEFFSKSIKKIKMKNPAMQVKIPHNIRSFDIKGNYIIILVHDEKKEEGLKSSIGIFNLKKIHRFVPVFKTCKLEDPKNSEIVFLKKRKGVKRDGLFKKNFVIFDKKGFYFGTYNFDDKSIQIYNKIHEKRFNNHNLELTCVTHSHLEHVMPNNYEYFFFGSKSGSIFFLIGQDNTLSLSLKHRNKIDLLKPTSTDYLTVDKMLVDKHLPVVYSVIGKTIVVCKIDAIDPDQAIFKVFPIKKWNPHSTLVSDMLKFDHNLLVTSSDGGTCRVWQLELKGNEFKRSAKKEAQILNVYKKDSIMSLATNGDYLICGSRSGGIKVFSAEYDFGLKRKVLNSFETKHEANIPMSVLKIDNNNHIYALRNNKIKVWPPSHLMKEHDFENVLKEPNSDITNAKVKRLEYHEYLDFHLILAYHDVNSGSGYVTAWVPTYGANLHSSSQDIHDSHKKFFFGAKHIPGEGSHEKSEGKESSLGEGLESTNKQIGVEAEKKEKKQLSKFKISPRDKNKNRKDLEKQSLVVKASKPKEDASVKAVQSLDLRRQRKSLSSLSFGDSTLKNLSWKYLYKFPEIVDHDGFSVTPKLKTMAIHDLEKNKIIIYDIALDEEKFNKRKSEISYNNAFDIRDISISPNRNLIAAMTKNQIMFWSWHKDKEAFKKLKPKANKQANQMAQALEKIVEIGEVKLDEKTTEKLENNFVINTLVKCKNMSFPPPINSELRLKIILKSKVEFYEFNKFEGYSNQVVDSFDKTMFENWQEQESIFFMNNRKVMMISKLDNTSTKDVVIVRLNMRSDRNIENYYDNSYNKIHDQNQSKQKKSKPKFNILQVIELADTRSHKSETYAKEVESEVFLMVFYRSFIKNVESFTEIYQYKNLKFTFCKKVNTSGAVCFDQGLNFIAFGSPKGENEIMIKKNSYLQGQLPESIDLYEHLVNVFAGEKNKINPKKMERMADYLKTNQFAFSDLIIHHELNILYLAVLSQSPRALKKCLEHFGYKKELYDEGLDDSQTMDPLIKAMTMNNEGMLDTFAQYFKENRIEDFTPDLFFKILKCESQKLKIRAVEQFLTPGSSEKDVFIGDTYPLPEKEGFEIIYTKNSKRTVKFRDILLKNMRSRSEKQTTVEYLTSAFPIDFSLRSEFGTKFISAVGKCDDAVILSDLRYLIRQVWKDNFFFVSFYSLVNLGAIALFFLWIAKYDEDWMIWVSVPIFIAFLIMEVIVMCADFRHYFKTLYNWIDMFQYISLPGLMIFQRVVAYDSEYLNDNNEVYNIITCTIMFLAFLRSLTMLRFWDESRYLVAMIFQAFKDIKAFVVVLGFAIFSFGLIQIHAFKTRSEINDQGLRVYKEELKFLETMDSMFNFAFGSWGNTGEYNTTQYYTFLVFQAFLPLVLMNLFIAIIWDTFANVKSERSVADLREMINILEDFNNLFNTLSFFGGKGSSKSYLHLIKKKDDMENNQVLKAFHDLGEKIEENTKCSLRIERAIMELQGDQEKLDDKMDKINRIDRLVSKLMEDKEIVEEPFLEDEEEEEDDVQSHGSVKASIHDEEDLADKLEEEEEEEDEDEAVPQELINEPIVSDTELDVTQGSNQELSEAINEANARATAELQSKFNSEQVSLVANVVNNDSPFKKNPNGNLALSSRGGLNSSRNHLKSNTESNEVRLNSQAWGSMQRLESKPNESQGEKI